MQNYDIDATERGFIAESLARLLLSTARREPVDRWTIPSGNGQNMSKNCPAIEQKQVLRAELGYNSSVDHQLPSHLLLHHACWFFV